MKIVIVDDDCLVTGALKTILEVNEDVDVVATGLDGRDAVRLYGEHKPDVLLMDIRMKNMNGLEAATEILYAYPDASILPALRAVCSGQTVFGMKIVSKIPDLIRNEDGFDYAAHGINEREKEIIRLIADGNSNKEIAAELYLSEGTVRNYLSSILNKLQLRDRTQVAVFYYQHK